MVIMKIAFFFFALDNAVCYGLFVLMIDNDQLVPPLGISSTESEVSILI